MGEIILLAISLVVHSILLGLLTFHGITALPISHNQFVSPGNGYLFFFLPIVSCFTSSVLLLLFTSTLSCSLLERGQALPVPENI